MVRNTTACDDLMCSLSSAYLVHTCSLSSLARTLSATASVSESALVSLICL